jgi:ankyrin repeat protein
VTVPLHQAAASGDLAALRTELDSGVNVNMPNEGELSVPGDPIQVINCWTLSRAEGWTALHHSIANGHLSTSEVLLESGADANQHHLGTLLAFGSQ